MDAGRSPEGRAEVGRPRREDGPKLPSSEVERLLVVGELVTGDDGSFTLEHYHKQFNVNVLGLLLTTQAALAHFNPKGGSIINIGSVAADGVPGGAVYSGTKGAVNSITIALSKELGPKQIRVNALNPGMVETEGVRAAGFIGSDFHQKAIKDTPLGRIGQPDDIATIAAFLASDESTWVSGQTIQASGGARL